MSAARASVILSVTVLLSGISVNSVERGHLRVCADPNNLPYSNDRLEGFENRLAALVARDLGLAEVRYTWWAQRRGFLRNTLTAGECDVVMGLPRSVDGAMTTRPYYRSTYSFVWRADRHLEPVSLEDPRLRDWRVGVQLVGDDGANPPPAHALSRRGIVRNVVGYTVYGNYSEENPAARIVAAVAAGDIDLAIAWGPLAGYFASVAAVPLVVRPVPQPRDVPPLPFSFDISMAVRRGDTALRDRLDSFIVRRRGDIEALLARYHVPRIGPPQEAVP
jgi:quinoprotein dehydrogenase-associated probable ABC transporter substrate-binding protein